MFRVFQSAAVPTRASGGGSGRLGAADPTPATQTAAFFGFRAVYPPRPSVHFPGSTGSGTICFIILCLRHPQAQFRTQAHSYGRMARAKRGRPGHPLAQGPWRGQLRGRPWRGQPWHGQPWKGRGEVFLYKKHFLISLSTYIYVHLGGGNPGEALATTNGKPWQLINREL